MLPVYISFIPPYSASKWGSINGQNIILIDVQRKMNYTGCFHVSINLTIVKHFDK